MHYIIFRDIIIVTKEQNYVKSFHEGGKSLNIKFHCSEKTNFPKKDQMLRAFSYTEYSIEPHSHDFYEMNIVLGGSGTHQIQDTTLKVRSGDVFVIPPMTVHAYYNTEHLEVYHILLKKELIRKNQKESNSVQGFLQLMEIEPFLRQSGADSLFLHLNQAQLSEIKNEIGYIEDKGCFGKPQFNAIRLHTVWKLIYYLSHLLHEQTVNDKKSPKAKYHAQALDTLEYIHQHFSEKLTIDSLAKNVYLSRSTFLRNFQITCGCSPIRYLNSYRVKKAMEMIEYSDMPKTEIAHFCGFYDLSHMEKSLKQAGYTP